MCQYLFLLALAGAASAYPLADSADPYAPPPPPPPPPKVYAPAPKPYAPPKAYAPAPAKPYGKDPDYPPQPYQYEYGVADQYTGAQYKAAETQDEKGTVLGESSQKKILICDF